MSTDDDNLIYLAAEDSVAPGEALGCDVAGIPICLARTDDGTFFAVADSCTHEQNKLSEGWVSGRTIECAAHNSIFDLETGDAISLPATTPVERYEVTLKDGDVYLVVGED